MSLTAVGDQPPGVFGGRASNRTITGWVGMPMLQRSGGMFVSLPLTPYQLVKADA